MKASKKVAALALAASLAGCAGVSNQQLSAQHEPIRTIALITVPSPAQYRTTDYGSKAGMFGAFGGVAIASSAEKMSDALTKAVKDSSFEYSRAMQAAVTDQL